MSIKNRFHMTYARSRPSDIVPYAEENGIGLMTNAAHRWSPHKEELLAMWEYDTHRIVDSGGYNVQSQYGGFPWSVSEYHDWLERHSDKFDWAAVMDYACESRFDDLHSVTERMEKTIQNTLCHFDKHPSYKLLPVLQGRTVEDWVWSYDQLVDYGIPVSDVGLGTVCRLSSTNKIVEVEKQIRERCPMIDNIHGFGVKVEAFDKGATFDSADSQAWVYAASNGRQYVDEGNRLGQIYEPDDSRKRTVESFKAYYDYVSRLFDRAHSDTVVRDGNSNIPQQKLLEQQAECKYCGEKLGSGYVCDGCEP